jgi:ABC-2 type transport system permease protein
MALALLRGELDALLTQPKGLISRLLARESIATAWGDLAGGLMVLGLFAGLSWRQAPLVALGVAAGMAVYVSAGISFASLAFWAAGARSFARDLTDFTLLFSTYPGSIYQGAVKVIAFTVLPAGFVVMLPVRLIRDPGPAAVAMVLAGAGLYVLIAVGLFHLGLRRYRRGQGPAS